MFELSIEQVNKLCAILGLDITKHKTQRIVIDIDCNRMVHAYTMSSVNGNQLTQLFSSVEEMKPSGSSQNIRESQ